MTELIKALQIFAKYTDRKFPTGCSHDTLHVYVDPDLVSEAAKTKLEELGFFVGEEWPDHFISFRYGIELIRTDTT